MKSVVDNVATQCWEDLLIKPLPIILTPSAIVDMDPLEIDRLAKEPSINVDQRDSLTKKCKYLS